jgi:hypothetical protein
VAAGRVNQILRASYNLSKLANPANYEYTRQDIDSMLTALQEAFRRVDIAFRTNRGRDYPEFDFQNREDKAS